MEIASLKNLGQKVAIWPKQQRDHLESLFKKQRRTCAVSNANAGCRRSHVTQDDIEGSILARQFLHKPRFKNIALENDHVSWKGVVYALDVNADHKTPGTDNDTGELQPGTGGGPEIENTISRFQELVALLNLLELIDRARQKMLFLGPVKVVILVCIGH